MGQGVGWIWWPGSSTWWSCGIHGLHGPAGRPCRWNGHGHGPATGTTWYGHGSRVFFPDAWCHGRHGSYGQHGGYGRYGSYGRNGLCTVQLNGNAADGHATSWHG